MTAYANFWLLGLRWIVSHQPGMPRHVFHGIPFLVLARVRASYLEEPEQNQESGSEVPTTKAVLVRCDGLATPLTCSSGKRNRVQVPAVLWLLSHLLQPVLQLTSFSRAPAPGSPVTTPPVCAINIQAPLFQ